MWFNHSPDPVRSWFLYDDDMSLQTVSNDLTNMIEMVSPHIVRVEARRRMPATGVVLGGGLIVTANHVVQKDGEITIGLEGGETAVSTLVGRDPTTDIALLKTDAELAKIAIAEGDVRVGNLIVAVARPRHNVQATLGMVSIVGGEWRTRMGGGINQLVSTDITMYPGFSGGALLNAEGQMVGLNSSALGQNMSVTIPAATVSRVVGSLAEHGHIKRAFLGVNTQMAKLPPAVREEVGQKVGLLITGVEADSPADSAGLVLGDAIVSVGDAAVRSHDDLMAQLTGDRIGQATPVKIVRGGAVQTVDVTLATR